MAYCPSCGTQLAEGAACPRCSAAAHPGASTFDAAATSPGSATSMTSTSGLTDNVAGALAYFTIIPAIIFLVLEPFNRKRFIRFHAFQCLFFAVAWTVLWIGLTIIGHVPVLGWATVLLWPLLSLAGFIIWLILVLKAYQGMTWKLPVVGDMADKQAGV